MRQEAFGCVRTLSEILDFFKNNDLKVLVFTYLEDFFFNFIVTHVRSTWLTNFRNGTEISPEFGVDFGIESCAEFGVKFGADSTPKSVLNLMLNSALN